MKPIYLFVASAAVIFAAGCAGADRDAGKEAQNGGTQGSTRPKAGEKEMTVKEHRSGEWTPGLSEQEKATLFTIAKDTLAWCIDRPREPFSFDGYSLTPKLKEPCATFVTLKMEGQLRGCIGSLAPVEAMYKSIHSNAINAALRDPRFPAVTGAELARIDVHISLLSPIVQISSPEEFKIGEHGIIVSQHGRRGVFLPEVAIEQNWTREQTLNYVCAHKAGLPPDAWKKGAKLEVFSSVVLSEE